jgi:molybdopterin molybdotransferase
MTPGSVVDSNRIVLHSYLDALGVECILAIRSADNRESLTAALQAAREADLIITTGGASVGDHDLVQDALLDAGGSVEFWQMALKPGKPVIVGRLGPATFLGLPGNPVSAAVTFRVFAQPLILRMAGDAAPHPTTLPIIAANGMRHRPGRVELARARLAPQDSGWMATLAARQSSAAHDAMIQFPSFVMIPSTHGDVKPGDRLQAIPSWGWRGQAISPFSERAPL